LALERATHRRRLLMDARLESYNVSVAAALALYELVRWRYYSLTDERNEKTAAE
jgi:tRNA G18 (ribose-2'-O)-methylase SpoU